MSLYNLHDLEFMATSHDKFWSHPLRETGLQGDRVYDSLSGLSASAGRGSRQQPTVVAGPGQEVKHT